MKEGVFEEWVILELMGHRKLAGKVTEQTIGASTFIRIDVPGGVNQPGVTQFYNPSAVYCITPTTSDIAERFARDNAPVPVSRWELPEQPRIADGEEMIDE